ncbi:MAG: DUF4258 domain-containing protein [Blastocatellia bacterium]|nr:DUF4258 domain-containing protein [Blastocatellia bacterium]
MKIQYVRELLREEEIELEFSLPHALVEARKDVLTEEDLTQAAMAGEVVEDYGERILLLGFVADYNIPFHIVLEYVAGDPVATIVTAYIPGRDRWEADWKTRKRDRRKKKRKKKG